MAAASPLTVSDAAPTWQYQELINGGMSPLSASLHVSQLLGHERPDVTRGYLASLPKSEYQPHSGHKNK